MKALPDMLQEFSSICRDHPGQNVLQLCNRYFGQLNEQERETAIPYFYWFPMVGEATRDERSFLSGD